MATQLCIFRGVEANNGTISTKVGYADKAREWDPRPTRQKQPDTISLSALLSAHLCWASAKKLKTESKNWMSFAISFKPNCLRETFWLW